MSERLKALEQLLIARRFDEAWDLVEKTLANEPDRSALRTWFVEAFPLSLAYGGEGNAPTWIRVFRRRNAPDPVAEALADVAELHLLWFQKRYAEGEKAANRLHWELVRNDPWAEHLQFFIWSYQSQRDRAFTAIRSGLTDLEEPGRIGARLALLLTHFSNEPRRVSCERLAVAAVAYLRRDDSLASRLREIEVLGRLAGLLSREGRNDEGIRYFRVAFELARAVNADLPRQVFCEEFAMACAHAGRFREARQVLRESPLPNAPRVTREHIAVAKRALCGATIALRALDEELAERELRRAFAILEQHPHPRLSANAWLLLGRTLSRSRARNHAKAQAALQCAERYFRSVGSRGTSGLIEAITARGELQLRSAGVREALSALTEASKLAQESGSTAARARCMELKSRLLAENAFDDAETCYEEILRDLGAVTEPTALFRILADLYVFSWRLGGRSDLTLAHHGQLRRLAGLLDEDVFRRLYNRHVRNPVGRRTIRKLFGCEPDELLD